ncbi:hypothetical protein O6H91_13G054800 [Diphasiastrum complanatum]|uniref:Uncharacterized protein n=1 Tax=Diphasiastrum complanatum TaxID=34168 RepID=A0ACC2BUW2_DIPCM|nr:hypothetical protein O6H91_Y172200 [Diphasiastrum complanatum]KAJ7533565.1 hypothetical protein O6H91_13G054800 [Diphasiastrum complanatum]
MLSSIYITQPTAMAGKEEKETIVMEGCALLLLGVFTILLSLNNNTAVVEAAPLRARVTSLPGFFGKFASVHYAGYVTIDKEHGRSLYYYFVTSENNPVSDPLVLWFNGGPACSSFYGFVFEHGPFNFIPGNGSKAMPTLVENPYTWAKAANMLYVDSPAGVGFSYSNNTNDYHTGDSKTASDAHVFLLKWFEDYSEFLSNPLYISGESYAGVYVPTLAHDVVNGIEFGIKPILNFKGYAIGNGATDIEFDGNAIVPFAYGMGLIPIDVYQDTEHACKGNYWNATTSDCQSKLDIIYQDLQGLNIYNILEPCYYEPSTMEGEGSDKIQSKNFPKLGINDHSLPIGKAMVGHPWPLRSITKDGLIQNWYKLSDLQIITCLDTHVADVWLNNASVRQALHALPEKLIGRWLVCSDRISYNFDAGSMIPIHRSLTSKGYRAIIYSGDHDMVIPFTGSEAWTRSLGYKVIEKWHPWFVGDQVAGYTTSYKNNFTFTTIKGSGHSVPEDKPQEALALFQRWLANTPL